MKMAVHKSGDLDARPVTRETEDAVWLLLATMEAGPFPAENYDYYEVEE